MERPRLRRPPVEMLKADDGEWASIKRREPPVASCGKGALNREQSMAGSASGAN